MPALIGRKVFLIGVLGVVLWMGTITVPGSVLGLLIVVLLCLIGF
jgi:uncharacterized protein (DUF39 family)